MADVSRSPGSSFLCLHKSPPSPNSTTGSASIPHSPFLSEGGFLHLFFGALHTEVKSKKKGREEDGELEGEKGSILPSLSLLLPQNGLGALVPEAPFSGL